MPLIFDVGAHKGEDTQYYLKKGFNVVAVEADPTLVRTLRATFAEAIRAGQLVVVSAAIAEEDGEVDFFASECSVFGSIRSSWAQRNEKSGTLSTKVTVPAVRFDKLLRDYGVPYYLKVDIEGADMLCIQALERWPTRPKFLSIESSKTSWRELRSEFDILDRFGYARFSVVNQAKIDLQREPSPAREGRFVDHRFAPGSSGLFGADLPGPWVTKRQALLRYAIIFLQYRIFGDNTRGNKFARTLPWHIQRRLVPGWYDTHAALE